MNTKPIKTKKGHGTALKRIEKLMSAEAGTKTGEELNILGALVDAYEEKHFPIGDPDPIEAIKHRVEATAL